MEPFTLTPQAESDYCRSFQAVNEAGSIIASFAEGKNKENELSGWFHLNVSEHPQSQVTMHGAPDEAVQRLLMQELLRQRETLLPLLATCREIHFHVSLEGFPSWALEGGRIDPSTGYMRRPRARKVPPSGQVEASSRVSRFDGLVATVDQQESLTKIRKEICEVLQAYKASTQS